MMIKIYKHTNLLNETIMHEKLVRAVDIHRKAMKLVYLSYIKVLQVIVDIIL